MADIFDLFGEDPSVAGMQAKALADAMRRRRAAGTLATIVGGPLAASGKAFLGDADQTAGTLSQAGQFRGQQAMQGRRLLQDAGQHQATLAQQAAALAESSRHNRAAEGLARGAQEVGASREAEKAATAKATAAAKAAEDLRKEFQGGNTYKNTQLIAESAKKILTSSDTGAGDMGLLYGYMKLLDPGSAVRESEFATAAQSGSLPAQVQGWASKILTGERLPASTRKQFKEEAKVLLKAQADRYEETAKPYRRLAESAGVKPEDVILDLGLQSLMADETMPGAAPAAPQRMQGKDGKWYRLTPAGWEAE